MVALCKGVYNGLMTKIGSEMKLQPKDSSAESPMFRAATITEAANEVVRIGKQWGNDLIHLNFHQLKEDASFAARNRPVLLTTIAVGALVTILAEPVLFGIGATFASLAVRLVAFTFSAIITVVSSILSCGVALVSLALRVLQFCFW